MNENRQRLTLRIPEELQEQLAAAAEAAGRSVNAEIVLRLRDSFASPYTYAGKPGPALIPSDRGVQISESERDHIADIARTAAADYLRAEGSRHVNEVLESRLQGVVQDAVRKELERRS